MCVAVCVAVCVGVWVRPQWGQWPMHKNFNSFWNFRSLIIIVVHNFKNHCYHIGKPVWSQWFFSMHYDDAFERIKMMRFNTSHWGIEMHRNDAFECIAMAHLNASQWRIWMHHNGAFRCIAMMYFIIAMEFMMAMHAIKHSMITYYHAWLNFIGLIQ